VEKAGAFHEELEMVVAAVDSKGKTQDAIRDVQTLRLSARTHEFVVRNGFRYARRLEVPPGRYQLRVGAREGNGGAVGSVMYDLDVPDFSKAPLDMSGLALASAWAGAERPTASPDPVFKDVLPGPPVAAREFPRNDTLAYFVEVYDNVTSVA